MVALYIYSSIVTILFLALVVDKIQPIYPLVQLPDRGNRIFIAPAEHHDTLVEAFRRAGLAEYGTFTVEGYDEGVKTQGLRRTLFVDGRTIIATDDIDRAVAAISFPVNNPVERAREIQTFLRQRGIETLGVNQPDIVLGKRLATIVLPWGIELAFRSFGRDLPKPRWE